MSHFETLRNALRAEIRAQREEHARLISLPLAERIAAGVTLAPLSLESESRGRRGRRILLLRGRDLHDGIGAGDRVILGPPADPTLGVRAVCVSVDWGAAEVSCWDLPDPAWTRLALTLEADERSLQRYFDALGAAESLESPLKSALLGGRVDDSVPSDVQLPGLNPSQQAAAAAVLAKPVLSVIHGPPGTGKTQVIAALAQHLSKSERVWALADSNAATDHLACRIAAKGLEVVRLGNRERIGPAAWPLSLDHRLETGPYAAALSALDREISRARSEGRSPREWVQERRRIEREARDQLLHNADVLACTLGSLARLAPELPRADVAIVDEATQALETAVWVAVPYTDRLVLVGDPHQLGPVVVSGHPQLERSLLQRLVDEGMSLPMLATQHRMHVEIQSLVDDLYPGLQPHPSVARHRLSDLESVASTPLTERARLWIDTAGAGLDEQIDPVTQSRFNPGEAELIGRLLTELLDAGLPPEAIGVITPYSAQCRRLSSRFPNVQVATVNAFQGREKEAILVSFVRSNADGEVGFNADVRRLTVALSRARRLLCCVGDSATLCSVPRFAEILDRFGDDLESVWEPPWSDLLEKG